MKKKSSTKNKISNETIRGLFEGSLWTGIQAIRKEVKNKENEDILSNHIGFVGALADIETIFFLGEGFLTVETMENYWDMMDKEIQKYLEKTPEIRRFVSA